MKRNLLEAFAQLAPAQPDWDLILVGDGPQRHNLEKLVGILKLENRVRLVGKPGNRSATGAKAMTCSLPFTAR